MSEDRPRISTLEIVALCAILLVAGWLRFYRLDQAEFQWDQSEISKWALNAGQRGEFRLIGPMSSTSLTTFPMAIWLLAIPFAISPSPVFATGFIALINLLAVIGCYFVTRRWFGRRAALVATLLFAGAPWAVVYSRKIWHTVLLPPLALLHVVTAWYAFVRGRRWALVVHGLVLAVLVQTHLSALPFVLLTGLWALVFFRRIDWRLLVLSALIAGLTFVPTFAADASRGWRSAHHFVALMQRPSTVDLDAAYATWVITTGTDLYWLTGPDRYPEFAAAVPNVRWAFAALGVLAGAGFLAAVWQAIRRARTGLDDESAAALMAATWLVMPALFLVRHNTWVAPHYFTTTFPAQFMLIGWLVSRAVRARGHVVQIGGTLLVLLIAVLAVAQVYEVTSVLRYVWTHDTLWGYGTPIAYEIEAVETAKRLDREIGGAEVILLSLGDEPRMYEMPNAADVLMYDWPHRAVDIQTALVFPSDPAVYWATCDVTPGEELLATLAPEAVDARVPLREESRSFRFYPWPGGEPDLACLRALPGGPRTWSNGARLIGYCLDGDLRSGGTVRWTLVWRPERTPGEDVYYHWFNHLVDGQGELQGQKDGPSLLPAYWRVDDTILNGFDLPIAADAPPGDYVMRVGMYRYPDLENVPLVDGGDDSAAVLEIELPLMGE